MGRLVEVDDEEVGGSGMTTTGKDEGFAIGRPAWGMLIVGVLGHVDWFAVAVGGHDTDVAVIVGVSEGEGHVFSVG